MSRAYALHWAMERSNMLFLRIGALVVGILAIAAGLLFLGQGTGIIMWPKESFMLADRTWARNGLLLAAVGAIVVWLASKRHR
jgi:membrane protein implicated in regulation of membrane protease activity